MLYFAYASNLDPIVYARGRPAIGSWAWLRSPTIASAFTALSPEWGGGRLPPSVAWPDALGIVFDLSDEDLVALDAKEGSAARRSAQHLRSGSDHVRSRAPR